MDTRGRKTAAAIYAEIIREIDQWLQVLFNGRRKTGHVDLEASEMMLRSAMHGAGAAEQRTGPGSCGHTAHYPGGPCSWIDRWWWENPCGFSMCSWMVRECRW